MPLHVERRATRLLALKTLQVQLRSGAANNLHAQAQQMRLKAQGLRESARQTVEAGIPLPEQGLGRNALFERLRLLAVARAHGMELAQHAAELEHQAKGLDGQEAEHRKVARAHQRKHAKLEHWQGQQRRHQRHLRDHQQTLELLEEAACRRLAR